MCHSLLGSNIATQNKDLGKKRYEFVGEYLAMLSGFLTHHVLFFKAIKDNDEEITLKVLVFYFSDLLESRIFKKYI